MQTVIRILQTPNFSGISIHLTWEISDIVNKMTQDDLETDPTDFCKFSDTEMKDFWCKHLRNDTSFHWKPALTNDCMTIYWNSYLKIDRTWITHSLIHVLLDMFSCIVFWSYLISPKNVGKIVSSLYMTTLER